MTLGEEFSARRPLVLVGAGKMGGALLSGWLEAGLAPTSVIVIDPAPPADSLAFLNHAGIPSLVSPPDRVTARLVVVAVKPQIIERVLPGIAPVFGRHTILLSVAAGTTMDSLEAGVGSPLIIRSIPNTPAQIGRGITAAIAGKRVSARGRKLAGRLLEAAGEVVWVEDESLIDSVTAVSGSGPAYVFLLAEALAEAGRAVGLDRKTADQLARATVAGAGELLHRSDLPASQLRKNVTSPKGTTAAALDVLMAPDGLSPLMKKAVRAARKRSRDFAG